MSCLGEPDLFEAAEPRDLRQQQQQQQQGTGASARGTSNTNNGGNTSDPSSGSGIQATSSDAAPVTLEETLAAVAVVAPGTLKPPLFPSVLGTCRQKRQNLRVYTRAGAACGLKALSRAASFVPGAGAASPGKASSLGGARRAWIRPAWILAGEDRWARSPGPAEPSQSSTLTKLQKMNTSQVHKAFCGCGWNSTFWTLVKNMLMHRKQQTPVLQNGLLEECT
ncbi:uncharacterized protein RBU33_022184 [Hipposideros larvatus]